VSFNRNVIRRQRKLGEIPLGAGDTSERAEHALIVEFLRRHHAVVAESSRALLRLLQTALRENAALASRTDESLLGTFQAYVDAALAEALRNAPAGAAPAARAVAASAAVSEAALTFR